MVLMKTAINKIYMNRLDGFRDNLDEFLENEYRPSEIRTGKSGDEKTDHIKWKLKKISFKNPFNKVLNVMKLNDDYEDEYDDCRDDNTKERKTTDNLGNIQHRDKLSRTDLKENINMILQTKAETFSMRLLKLIDEKSLRDSDVYKRAQIDRRLFSKIRGNEDYVPSKKTAISFCFALRLNIDEANALLATAGYALSASSRFDLIIMYLIRNQEYNIQFANLVLDEYGESTLSR